MCGACLAGSDPADLHGVSADLSETADLGLDFVRRHRTIDLHAHPGRFFLDGETAGTALARQLGPSFIDASVADMRAGGVGCVCFATVADHVLLESTATGLRAVRDFAPGEAYADHRRQLAVLKGAMARLGLATDAVSGTVDDGRLAALITVEGGDFIEHRLERIAAARADGVRAITIIHYHVNQIGDTQTEPALHGGLSPLGRDVVAEMERNGILVDLSHATFAACAAVAQMATRPPILSHSNLRRPQQSHPRLIDLDHARLITELGGVVGAVPAGFDQSTFEDYIETILYMAETLGVGHVAIGTDMDYTFRPVMSGYRQWPAIAEHLLQRGMAEDEVAAIMGGNVRRLLDRQP